MAYTFPSCGILSQFTGSENPISEGGFWYFDTRLESSAAQKSSGVLTGSIADYYAAVYKTIFGPECENYVTMPNSVTFNAMILRLKFHQGVSDINSYITFINLSTMDWDIEVVTNGSSSVIAGPINQTISAGDAVGIGYQGGVFKGYYKASGGSWTTKLTATDSTLLTASGLLGIEANGTQQYDDFGGGTLYPVPDVDKSKFPHPILRAPLSQGRLL